MLGFFKNTSKITTIASVYFGFTFFSVQLAVKQAEFAEQEELKAAAQNKRLKPIKRSI